MTKTRAAMAALMCLAVLAIPAGATASSGGGDDGAVAHGVSRPHQDSYYPAIGDPSVDALHYAVDVSWSASHRRLRATTTLRFRAPRAEDHVQLDLEKQLDVASVRLDGRGVGFRHPGKDLVVRTGRLARDSRHTLVVRYAGRPRPYAFPGTRGDVTGLGWTTTEDGQVWSMQEPYGAFTWYPSNDQPGDKATYDVTISTQADWHGVSNGRLVSDDVTDGVRTSHFRLSSPSASYLVTIAIGPYREHTATGPHGLPVTYWVRPSDRSVLPWLKQTPAILRQLESRLGPYPFDRAGTVVVPSNSAMETQTMVTMGNGVAQAGRRGFLGDLAHEYAHAWYGDTVTPTDWRDLWMNESFTMFDQIRWEIDRGWSTEDAWRGQLDAYDGEYRHDDGPPGAYKKDQFASASVYYSGARMLLALRDKIGTRVFDRMLRAWPARHRYQSVDRAEWVAFADRFTGRHLDGFVRHWLTSRTAPAE